MHQTTHIFVKSRLRGHFIIASRTVQQSVRQKLGSYFKYNFFMCIINLTLTELFADVGVIFLFSTTTCDFQKLQTCVKISPDKAQCLLD